MVINDLSAVKSNHSMVEVKEPKLFQILLSRNSEFLPFIRNLSRKIEPLLNEIPRVFATYTLHDINHSIRVMEYMYDLISDAELLSDLDISILISSALLHDVGMRVGEEEIKLIKEGAITYSDIKFSAILKKYEEDEQEALREYVRLFHSDRSGEYILKELKDDFQIPSLPGVRFEEDVAKVCIGHAKELSWLKDNLKPHSQKGNDNYSPLFCGMLLRVADILDIDSERTPPFLYKQISPKGYSKQEWLQHFKIHNSNKVNTNDQNEKVITIYGECDNPDIHRKLLNYIDWINTEINNTLQVNEGLIDDYKINIKYPLENHIEPKGYTISDMQLKIDFNAISNLLMGERIYGERKLGLRELVQNSIDACKVRSEMEMRKEEYYGVSEYNPTIKVILDKEQDQFIVKDNGIGMSIEILEKYFLNVGVSYYRSDDFLLKEFEYTPIGNFGIGFLACFMLSKDVQINTRYINSHVKYLLSLTKDSPYICLNENKNVQFNGTEVILNYKEVMSLFRNDANNVKLFLQKYFLTMGIEFTLIDVHEKKKHKIVNKLFVNSKKDKKTERIILSDYLHHVEGFIDLTIRKNKSGSSLADIPFPGEAYVYKNDKLIKLEEDGDIRDLYHSDSHSFKYLSIPIIPDEHVDEYNKILDVLGDHGETIERLEEQDLDYISIFYLADNDYYNHGGLIEQGDNVFLNFEYEDLEKFGHNLNIPTMVYNNSFNLFFTNDKEIFLPLNDEPYNLFYLYENRDLFLRNTLVSEYRPSFVKKLSFIEIYSIRLNVYSNVIISDVSRNRLDKESDQLITAALNKVLCLWILEKIDLTADEKVVLEDYIKKFHGAKNTLVKTDHPVKV